MKHLRRREVTSFPRVTAGRWQSSAVCHVLASRPWTLTPDNALYRAKSFPVAEGHPGVNLCSLCLQKVPSIAFPQSLCFSLGLCILAKFQTFSKETLRCLSNVAGNCMCLLHFKRKRSSLREPLKLVGKETASYHVLCTRLITCSVELLRIYFHSIQYVMV